MVSYYMKTPLSGPKPLFPALILFLALLLHSPLQAQYCCDGNLLTNSDFEIGNSSGPGSFSGCSTTGNYVTDWCGSGSPQYRYTLGNLSTRGIIMWGIGENFSAGEGIYQAVNITAGDTISLRFDGRFSDQVPTGPDSVILRFAAFTSAPTATNAAGGTIIGEFVLKNTYWGSFHLPCWVADANYNYLQISPRNGSLANSGQYVSWVFMDNVCMTNHCLDTGSIVVQSPAPFPDPEVTLYPNPATELLALQFPAEWGAPLFSNVYDLQGRLVDAPITAWEASEIRFNLSELPNGIYHLNIGFANGPANITEKFEVID